MPFINGRFYMNPAYGRAVEDHRANADEAISAHQEKQAQSEPPRRAAHFAGEATYYNLPGKKTASGEKFDPNKIAAAMTSDKVKLGQTVTVTYTSKDAQGKTVTRTMPVMVNDRGPFARGADGKAISPLQPDPGGVIDLTPAAFKKLVGSTKPGRVPVIVTVPNE